ncbi:MAG: hypothetical protein WC297_01170 [Candidatus Paceibacterota bacterium]
MKEKIKDVACGFGKGIIIFLVSVLYVVVGFMIATPYIYLAGNGNIDNMLLATVVSPAISIILFCLYALCRFCKKDISDPDSDTDTSRIARISRKIFWTLFSYCLLPIFMNGISIVLKWIGVTTVGNFIFKYRYISLSAIPLTIIIGLIIYWSIKDAWHKRFSSNATPPSSIPPSDFSLNKTTATSSSKKEKIGINAPQSVSI